MRASSDSGRRRSAEIARAAPLQALFDPPPDVSRDSYPLAHADRRRARNNKRANHMFPKEIASQMMLRASRSSRPYDVPQIGESYF